MFFNSILETLRQCGIFSFSIICWKRSDIVVFFVFLLDFGNRFYKFFYYILVTFQHSGISCVSIRFWKHSDIVLVFFNSILELFSIIFWKLSISVVLFVFLLDFGNVPTVWYFSSFFSIRVWKCSDSVVFFVFLLDF